MELKELISKCDYVNWLCQNYRYLNEKRQPKIRHIVYIEQLINGIGVHTDKKLFELYLKAWKDSGKLTYYYNPHLDCIDYYIDNFLTFRKYDYSCLM